MLQVTDREIEIRLHLDNPWWRAVELTIASYSGRSAFIDFHSPCPGSFTSQNVQPLTELPVMEIAAEEGESKRFPSTNKAPSLTSARCVLPLYFARTSVP